MPQSAAALTSDFRSPYRPGSPPVRAVHLPRPLWRQVLRAYKWVRRPVAERVPPTGRRVGVRRRRALESLASAPARATTRPYTRVAYIANSSRVQWRAIDLIPE